MRISAWLVETCDTRHTTGKSIVIYRFSCAQGLVEDSALSVVVNLNGEIVNSVTANIRDN